MRAASTQFTLLQHNTQKPKQNSQRLSRWMLKPTGILLGHHWRCAWPFSWIRLWAGDFPWISRTERHASFYCTASHINLWYVQRSCHSCVCSRFRVSQQRSTFGRRKGGRSVKRVGDDPGLTPQFPLILIPPRDSILVKIWTPGRHRINNAGCTTNLCTRLFVHLMWERLR